MHFDLKKIIRLGIQLMYKIHSIDIFLHCIAHYYINTHYPMMNKVDTGIIDGWCEDKRWTSFPVVWTTDWNTTENIE